MVIFLLVYTTFFPYTKYGSPTLEIVMRWGDLERGPGECQNSMFQAIFRPSFGICVVELCMHVTSLGHKEKIEGMSQLRYT